MRAHCRGTVLGLAAGNALNPLPGAQVALYDVGTTTPITDLISAGPTGSTTLANPVPTDGQGNYEFWLEKGRLLDLFQTYPGLSSLRIHAEARAVQLDRYTKNFFDYLTEAQIADVQARTETF